jgi:DNA repair exonuclease SbcCD ATPase subunit
MKYVNFKKITVKNFLSIGEDPVSVEFSKGLHIITGNNKDKPDRRNAIGKSSIAESIYFAIFGETLRDLKKDLIPNNITGGKTHVELDFEVITSLDTKKYKVIRNLSPSKIEIFENEIEKTLDSISNTNKFICDVIGASPAIFQNCVIMTVNDAIPFMAKSKIDKRKFIEDIFGLQVFSDMISALRTEYNDIKRDKEINFTKLTEAEKTLKSYKDQQIKMANAQQEKLNLYESRKINNLNEKNQLLEIINSIESVPAVDILQSIVLYEEKLNKCEEYIKSYNDSIAVNKQRITDLKSNYQKIGTSEETCPICLRSIEDHDLNYIKSEKDTIKANIDSIVLTIKGDSTLQEEYANKKALIKSKLTSLKESVHQNSLKVLDKKHKQERIEQLDYWLNELDSDIENLSDNSTNYNDIIAEQSLSVNELTVKEDELSKRLSDLDIVKYVVSEEGVKSYIVNKLLDMLNNRLLFYLKKLDSNSICMFNEYFEEEILNEKNKICSYFNFSGAERKAIDLACLFTFSDLRRMQGGVSYNIAIYDELFDSSFDEKGIELVTDVLKTRIDELDECVIIISHRKESIKQVTGDIIFLEKSNGITTRIPYTEI